MKSVGDVAHATVSNPADIASREAKCSELKSNELWWNGQPFLQKKRSRWPMNVTCTSSGISKLDEVKCEEKHAEVCNTFLVSPKCPDVKLSSVINCEKFSKLNKLLRITAYVL